MSWQELVTSVRTFTDLQLFEVAGTPITPLTLALFVALVGLTFVVSHLVEKGLERFFAKRQFVHPGTTGALRRLLYYFMVATGFGVALQMVGINLATLFAAGAVFAVAVGFAMQNIMQNFVSGVIMLSERAIKPGDVLEMDGAIVRVATIGIRATVVRTRDDEDLIVPNSLLVQSSVKNYTLRDSTYRLRAQVGVAYSSDLELVESSLRKAAAEIPWRRMDRDPVLLLLGFGNSSVDLEVSVWIDDPWQSQQLRSRLHFIIWWALKEQGITIAFPQLDVHFDPPAPGAATRPAQEPSRLALRETPTR